MTEYVETEVVQEPQVIQTTVTYEVLPPEEDGDGTTREVLFTCSETGITTTRSVNYVDDEDLWKERLEQQALGVSNKISVGIIKNDTE